jgi:hypothetical protein
VKGKIFFVLVFCGCISTSVLAQSPTSAYRPPGDPLTAAATDLAKISRSVQTLSATLQAFVDKFEKVSGLTLTEKQQKLILGMELLTRTEQRVITQQKSQTDLTEKLNSTRTRLTYVETELRPRNVNNSTTFAGSTETEELRESRRIKLERERTTLSQLETQIQGNLFETGNTLRDAQALAERLRKTFLPQVERELFEQ